MSEESAKIPRTNHLRSLRYANIAITRIASDTAIWIPCTQISLINKNDDISLYIVATHISIKNGWL